MSPRAGAALWYLGRFLQMFAMWILVVDIFVMAGPMGPPPKPFFVGIAVFMAGWGLTKVGSGTKSP